MLYYSDKARAVLFIHEAFWVQLLLKTSSRTHGSHLTKWLLDYNSPLTAWNGSEALSHNYGRISSTNAVSCTALSLTTRTTNFGTVHA